MKSILILLGLVMASLTAYSQRTEKFSHKDLGLGYRPIPDTSLIDKQIEATPRDLLDKDSTHNAMVRAFARRFSGQDSVVLTASLLNSFAATKNESAGVHLFLGNANGKRQVIITHTRTDTIKVNDTFTQDENALSFDAAANYNVAYDRAYYWNNETQDWQLVESQGALKQSILNSRKRAINKYGYTIQGYYLSKDLLLKIREESGQDLLTVFLGQEGDVFHLIIPILRKTPSAAEVFHYATDYIRTSLLDVATNRSGPAQGSPPPKDHNTVRTCQPYCND